MNESGVALCSDHLRLNRIFAFRVVMARFATQPELLGEFKPGELFATFHNAEVFLNRVTSGHRDRYVKSPEYKVTAVRIVRLDDRGHKDCPR